MILKCPCQQCGTNLEFEAEQLGQFITCPSCEKQTRLLDRAPGNSFLEQLDAPLPLTAGKPVAAQGAAMVTATGPPRNGSNVTLVACPDCKGAISQRALMCPACGSTAGIRFKLVWDVMCHVGVVGLIFAFIAWIFTILAAGAFMAWRGLTP